MSEALEKEDIRVGMVFEHCGHNYTVTKLNSMSDGSEHPDGCQTQMVGSSRHSWEYYPILCNPSTYTLISTPAAAPELALHVGTKLEIHKDVYEVVALDQDHQGRKAVGHVRLKRPDGSFAQLSNATNFLAQVTAGAYKILSHDDVIRVGDTVEALDSSGDGSTGFKQGNRYVVKALKEDRGGTVVMTEKDEAGDPNNGWRITKFKKVKPAEQDPTPVQPDRKVNPFVEENPERWEWEPAEVDEQCQQEDQQGTGKGPKGPKGNKDEEESEGEGEGEGEGAGDGEEGEGEDGEEGGKQSLERIKEGQGEYKPYQKEQEVIPPKRTPATRGRLEKFDRYLPKFKEYKELKRMYASEILMLRSKLTIQNEAPSLYDVGLRTGRLNGRHLVKHQLDPKYDRVFKKKEVIAKPKVALTILVDESGSMNGGGSGLHLHGRHDNARKLAIVMAEAVRGIAGVDLSVLGHTSGKMGEYGKTYRCMHQDLGQQQYQTIQASDVGKPIPWDRESLMLTHYYTPEYPVIETLGHIRGLAENYDGHAVHEVTDLMVGWYPEQTKLLVILSDGRPVASKYGDGASVLRKYSDDARRRGVNVLGIGLDNAYTQETGESMYGPRCCIVLPSVMALPVLGNWLSAKIKELNRTALSVAHG